jgi:HD-like signal output (HDOD) protein/CheY-like chemotaxis protein
VSLAQQRPVIVFLDDESPILGSLRSLLRREGYAMEFFQSAADALGFVNKNVVDVIVSDLRMPEMTGIEFLNKVSGIMPDSVRIMLSGYEDKSTVLSALSTGLAQQYVLKPWDDEALRNMLRRSVALLQDQREQRLRSLLGTQTNLPVPVKLLHRLHRVLSDESSSLGVIVKEIENSPPVVARILRVANSIHYGSRRTITSLKDAVGFIGTEYVNSIVLSIEAFQEASAGVDGAAAVQAESIWAQSVHRAMLARLVASRVPGFRDISLAHVTSLLQDIGYVVFLCYDYERFNRMAEFAKERNLTWFESEARVFGATHDEVGASLLRHWNFPEQMVDAVALSHRKTSDDVLPQILQIADLLGGGELLGPHDSRLMVQVERFSRELSDYLPLQTAG